MEAKRGRVVTVCDACLKASCWHGVFMCDRAETAGTTTRTVAELAELGREHPDYYSAARCAEVEGTPVTVTAKQLQALRFIARYTAEHGYPPSQREIGDGLGLGSTNGVAQHVTRLARKGLIRVTPYVSRGLVVTDEGWALLESDSAQERAAEGGT